MLVVLEVPVGMSAGPLATQKGDSEKSVSYHCWVGYGSVPGHIIGLKHPGYVGGPKPLYSQDKQVPRVVPHKGQTYATFSEVVYGLLMTLRIKPIY